MSRLMILSCLSLATLASAQQFTPATAANAKQFVGVWKGDFHGTPFVTVTIATNGDKLTGSVSHFNIDVNDAGELTKAEPAEGENPIKDAQVNDKVLRITAKSTDGSEDELQADLKLIGDNQADMRIVLPPDVPPPKPKPWHLQRAKP